MGNSNSGYHGSILLDVLSLLLMLLSVTEVRCRSVAECTVSIFQ